MTKHLLPLALLAPLCGACAADPLPSWHDTANREAIVAFVENAGNPASAGYIAPAERIAVFDNDGNLWAEKPVYFQLLYVVDRLHELAAEHPQWQEEEPYASALRGDYRAALAGGEAALLKLVLATHGEVPAEEFAASVRAWLDTATHPATGRKYTAMVYQPMLELLAYLRANGFKTFIVSGGGIDFLRVFAEETYGIPPEQVVGSSVGARYEVIDGVPQVIKEAKMDFIDDKAGKPVGIHQHIGRRPVLASGNSDGDFQMLEWTTAGSGPRLGLLLHHDDAEREYAYDRDSHVGKLARGLDEGPEKGWLIISMKDDWATIFPPLEEDTEE